MDLWLNAKVAVIADASGAIGGPCAEALAAEGARIALLGASAEHLESVAADIQARHAVEARAFVVDLASTAATSDVFGAVARQFGRIDVLVAAAAALSEAIGMARAALSLLADERPGRVVLAAVDLVRAPEARATPDAAASAAGVVAAGALAEELRPLGIAIGIVQGRATADDVAQHVAFLASRGTGLSVTVLDGFRES